MKGRFGKGKGNGKCMLYAVFCIVLKEFLNVLFATHCSLVMLSRRLMIRIDKFNSKTMISGPCQANDIRSINSKGNVQLKHPVQSKLQVNSTANYFEYIRGGIVKV
jgi:hypothetical protein